MCQDYLDLVEIVIDGFIVMVDEIIGYIVVFYYGLIIWDQLQWIKN